MTSHLKWNYCNNSGIWQQYDALGPEWLDATSWPPHQSSSDMVYVLVCWGLLNKIPQLGSSEQQKWIVSVLKARSPTLRYRHGRTSSGGTREDMFQASLLVSGRSLACGSTVPIFMWHCHHVSVRVQIFPFYMDICYIGSWPTLL